MKLSIIEPVSIETETVDEGTPNEHVRECRVPAVGKCGCGREILLQDFRNACRCGAEWNQQGDRVIDFSWANFR